MFVHKRAFYKKLFLNILVTYSFVINENHTYQKTFSIPYDNIVLFEMWKKTPMFSSIYTHFVWTLSP